MGQIVKRGDLIQRVRETLAKCGFYVSEPHLLQSVAFDIVARRDERLLVLKTLSNVDALSREDAEQLSVLAKMLKANPIVIGLHSSAGELEDGIVYSRFGIPIISLQTFTEYLIEGIPPFVFAAPGGLYVRIDQQALRALREERNLSLGALADIAGVSRRAIQMYESGMGAMIDVVERLETYLRQPLALPLDPFHYTPEIAARLRSFSEFEELSRDVFSLLETLGYSVVPTVKCPFEALTSDGDQLLLTGVGHEDAMTARRIQVVTNIARITERRSVLFVDRRRRWENIGGSPVIGTEELRKADDTEAIFELIIERSREKGRR